MAIQNIHGSNTIANRTSPANASRGACAADVTPIRDISAAWPHIILKVRIA